MQSRRPAPLNVVPSDSEGTTWALPEGAIARLGKGRLYCLVGDRNWHSLPAVGISPFKPV